MAEERRRPPVGVLEPVKQFWHILCEAGADEAARDNVEPVLVIQREENEVVARVNRNNTRVIDILDEI